MSHLLEINEVSIHFHTDAGAIEAVDAVSFTISRGEIVGLVGESGSGKSVTALAILGLIRPPGRIVHGSIRFAGRELLGLPEDAMRQVRGAQIAMIFQQPRTALNPVLSVGRQIARLYQLHQGCSRRQAWQCTLDVLHRVGIPEPGRRATQYAHQLSGGMCQRVMIAMAVATSPRLLLADEPTTGLDVSIAAQILDLLQQLGQQSGTTMLLITHDLGVVAGLCHRVAVMHAGQLAEYADVPTLFRNPLHPYTQALVRSVPRVDREVIMEPIPGQVPSLLNPPPGCRYADRCPLVMTRCRQCRPALRPVGREQIVACHAVEDADAAPRHH